MSTPERRAAWWEPRGENILIAYVVVTFVSLGLMLTTEIDLRAIDAMSDGDARAAFSVYALTPLVVGVLATAVAMLGRPGVEDPGTNAVRHLLWMGLVPLIGFIPLAASDRAFDYFNDPVVLVAVQDGARYALGSMMVAGLVGGLAWKLAQGRARSWPAAVGMVAVAALTTYAIAISLVPWPTDG